MIDLVAFLFVSAFFVIVSHASLRDPRSHGFYRFFAWEFMLVLVLLNRSYWFREPFAVHQLMSWLLLAASAALALFGFHSLHTRGRPDPGLREDDHLYRVEKTTGLVRTGAYRYVRHPLYGSLIIGAWGALFKHLSWPGCALALAASLAMWLTAKVEERECVAYFGDDYERYREQTRMFVPFLF